MTTMMSHQELEELSRKKLQSVAKKHGVKANLRTSELIEQILDVMEGKENSGERKKRNVKAPKDKKKGKEMTKAQQRQKQRERSEVPESDSTSEEENEKQELSSSDLESEEDKVAKPTKAASKKKATASRSKRRGSMRVRLPPADNKDENNSKNMSPIELYREISQLPQRQLYHVFGALLGQRKEGLFKEVDLSDKAPDAIKIFVVDDHSAEIEEQLVFDIAIALGIAGHNCLFTLRGNSYDPHDFTFQIEDEKYDCGFDVPLKPSVDLAGGDMFETFDPLEDGDDEEKVGDPEEKLEDSLDRMKEEFVGAVKKMPRFKLAAKAARMSMTQLTADLSEMIFSLLDGPEVDQWELPFFRFPEGAISANAQSLIKEMNSYSKAEAQELDTIFAADAQEIITEQLEGSMRCISVGMGNMLDSFHYRSHNFVGTSASPTGRIEFLYQCEVELFGQKVTIKHTGKGTEEKMRVHFKVDRDDKTLVDFRDKKYKGKLNMFLVLNSQNTELLEWCCDVEAEREEFIVDLSELFSQVIEMTARDLMIKE